MAGFAYFHGPKPTFLVKWCRHVRISTRVRGRRGHEHMVVGFTTTYATSIYNHQRSNPAHGVVYSLQHHVIKFVSNLRLVDDFLQVLPVSSSNKTDLHDITEILLKVVLITIECQPIYTYTYSLMIGVVVKKYLCMIYVLFVVPAVGACIILVH